MKIEEKSSKSMENHEISLFFTVNKHLQVSITLPGPSSSMSSMFLYVCQNLINYIRKYGLHIKNRWNT